MQNYLECHAAALQLPVYQSEPHFSRRNPFSQKVATQHRQIFACRLQPHIHRSPH
jgi:hypothetical protein